MLYLAIIIHASGGLEPRWGVFGGFEPMIYVAILVHANGGLEPRREFGFDLSANQISSTSQN